MSGKPVYPVPPLQTVEPPQWVSLMQAAADLARSDDRGSTYFLDEMMRSFWSGEFEEAGAAKLFTFEVPQAYRQLVRKSDVETRLEPTLRSGARIDHHQTALDEATWVIDPLDESDGLPIVALEEEIRSGDESVTVLFPEYWFDERGELWITKVDETGTPYSVPSQDRDICHWSRYDVMMMLAVIGFLSDHRDVLLRDDSSSRRLAESLYEVMAKVRADDYSDNARSCILSSLHIATADLANWARRKRFPFPYKPDPCKSDRLKKVRQVSFAQIDAALKEYREEAGYDAPQYAAIAYVREKHPNAAREVIITRWHRLVPEHQRRPGRKPQTAH